MCDSPVRKGVSIPTHPFGQACTSTQKKREVWKGKPAKTRATAERIISEAVAAGDAAAGAGNYPAAVIFYTAALKTRSIAEILTKRARCSEILGEHERALCDLSLLCRIEPANWSHRLGRASLFRELGQLSNSPGALLDLDEAVSLAAGAPDRERSPLLSTRAGVREEAARWEEAIEDYTLLLELLPAESATERARVLLRRGCCGLRMALSEAGMRDLHAVVQLAPSLPEGRLQLGRALRRRGEWIQANVELGEGLRLVAHNPTIYSSKTSSAHHPLQAALLRERARVLRCLRRPEEALPLLRKACEAEPHEAAHTLALGAALLQAWPAPLHTRCTPAAHPLHPSAPSAPSAPPVAARTCPVPPAAGQAARASSRGLRELDAPCRGGVR